MSKGICVAGNMLVDILYPVNGWPKRGELVHIMDGISRSTGGAACNVLIDLARIDPELPLLALGRIGCDGEGDLIMEKFHEHDSIDTSHVIREGVSAFTLVMSDLRSKERTFFTHFGANGVFDESDIDWNRIDCDILHIGYILALNALDQADAEYGSKMARLLHDAQLRGIKTSIDVVSEAGSRFRALVPAALRYTDYCVINEIEAEQSTGVPLRQTDGRLLRENIPAALERMRALGVRTWAVIHSPEGGFGMDAKGNYAERESLCLPEGYIRGTVGAGDAFCAGVLYAAEKRRSLGDAIMFGNACAACSLSAENATDGVRSAAETMRIFHALGGR